MSYLPNFTLQSTGLNTIPRYKDNLQTGLNIPFEIHDLEWLQHHRPFKKDVPVQLTHYAICWIRNGTGICQVDLDHYPLQDNMILCLSPGQLICLSGNVCPEGCFISFSPEFLLLSDATTDAPFLEALFDHKNTPVVYPDADSRNEIEDIVRKMKKEFGGLCMLRSQVLKGLLKLFLIYLSRCPGVENQQIVQDRDREMARKFTALVKKNFLTKKMVVDYARDLCVSPNYLNRIVKKISGFTASHHIQQHIILEAKRQAIYSGLSMKEVACLLGFNDYAHFSKFFKINAGSNFTCFKNSVQ